MRSLNPPKIVDSFMFLVLFCYIFLSVFRGPFSDNNMKTVLSKIFFLFWTQSSRMSKNMCKLCLKSPTILPHLSRWENFRRKKVCGLFISYECLSSILKRIETNPFNTRKEIKAVKEAQCSTKRLQKSALSYLTHI